MSEITNFKLCDLVDKIKKKELSSKEITEAFINRSKKSTKLNSYISDNFDDAINRAKEFDSKPNLNKKIPINNKITPLTNEKNMSAIEAFKLITG